MTPLGPSGAPALDFVLPSHLEAREPPEARGLPRDGVRLLVSYRRKDGHFHARFSDLPSFLDPGDVLVVNDSPTLPAALRATTPEGGALALHLSTHLPGDLWVVEPRGTTPPGHGTPPFFAGAPSRLTLPGGGAALLLAPYRDSRRLWVARIDLPLPVLDYLARWGAPIRYGYVDREWPIDLYQTIFAAPSTLSSPGSAEMPSAGRAFTPAVLQALEERGVQVARLTLHTGVASAEHDEPPYEEAFAVPWETATAVNAAREAGRRVVATGTTCVRALESATEDAGRAVATRGWTDLIVTPQRGVRLVDALLTGFHEPKASHLLMLEAIAGREMVERSYRAALEHGYRWHEFGDSHLILAG
jgi:S-adenosylmethionine:tRNA ribosyltransferase-isomerase